VQTILLDDWNNPRYMCFEERDATDEFDTDDEFAVAVAVAAYGPMYTEKRPVRVAVIALG
jgi:hypothetical protein